MYDSFINSQRWLEIRRPIIARANGYCEHCRRKTARLDVHHLTYVRFGGDELPRDLEALCEDCHPEADQSRRAAIAALREYKRELRAYEGFMHWKYGEGWHRDPYAYSLASFQEFEETTRQWDDEAERDYGHYQDYDEE